jgi:hypothetical protein
MVGLSCSLGKVFDLVVLDADLLAREIILALQPLDVGGRALSRLVGGSPVFLGFLNGALCRCGRCRGMPRLVATGRTSSM